MSADQWCIGWRRTPHVPDGGLVQVLAPRSFRLCRDCWRAWNSNDRRDNRD